MKPEDPMLHKEIPLPIGCSEAKAKLSVEDAYQLWKQGKLRTEEEFKKILPVLK